MQTDFIFNLIQLYCLIMESITKSIIYGNSYKNNYGKFLPICSSISDRSAIGSIVEYLKESPHFLSYNRIAYAYRVQEVPIVFITEKKNAQINYYEDYYSDQTVEGSGQKLMHLLEKFNIRNVFLCILIQQFNPLMPFQVTNYRAIVQNCRLLLDELYRKVITLQQESQARNINDLLLHNNRTVKMKKCNLNQEIQMPKVVTQAPKERPTHIYSQGKPQFLSQPKINQKTGYTHQINFLWERCKSMKQNFEQILIAFTQKQLQQLKYFAMYDRNQLINLVIQMFMIYQNVTKQHLLSDYDFLTIREIPFENIQPNRLKKMENMLKTNRKLTVDTILGINKAMGTLFSIMQLAIRFSKTLQRITDLLAKSEKQRNESNGNQQSFGGSKGQLFKKGKQTVMQVKKSTINVQL